MSVTKKLVLSISMLVSNGRRDTIEKCMESLVPLRRAVPSELILVDTGCTDGSIEIARKYADQVLTFKWCNDFSAARNKGLFACSGEWFLYLDDDEWFEDTMEIEQFFLSGEYKKYDGAWYIQRNYDDFDGRKYTDTYVGRMSPITRETKFVNKIHENISPASKKIKFFSSFVHHYGYVFKNEEERKRHFLRNLTLEEAAVAEHPEDVRMCCQLVQEYRAARRFLNAEQFCRETLEKKLYPVSNYFVQYLMTCLPRIYAEQERYQEAISEYERLEASGELVYVASVLCMYEKLYIYGLLGEDEKLLLQAEKYLNARDVPDAEEGYPVMDFAQYISDTMYQRVVGYGIKTMFRLKSFEKTGFFFQRFDWTREENSEEYIRLLLMAYQETADASLLTDMTEKISNAPKLRRKWFTELEGFLKAYAGESGLQDEKLSQETFQIKARNYMEAAKSAPILVPVLRIWMKEMELVLLSEQMREIITAQIEAGNAEEAGKLLSEVEGMLPGEEWIHEIRIKLRFS